MHQDESFLPDTTMPVFGYRGPQGQTIPNYAANTGASVMAGMSGMGNPGSHMAPSTLAPLFGIAVGAGVMCWGARNLKKKSDRSTGYLGIVVGLAIAYLGGIKQIRQA